MENKEKIKQLRARIARLNELLEAYDSGEPSGMRQRKDVLAEIAKLKKQIDEILKTGNGDGSGRRQPSNVGMSKGLTSGDKTKPM
tara:strand:+ start:3532 stop:3786 length:255 start_codon:yes stop_codon:yes gene_type:complete